MTHESIFEGFEKAVRVDIHPVEPNMFEFIDNDGKWCTLKHWITLGDLKTLYAERARLRAEVERWRKERATAWERGHCTQTEAAAHMAACGAFDRVLTLLDGEEI